MNQTSCFSPAHILLPAEQIPLEQWGCVACDQFTSDRSYWERAAEAAAGSPSALNLILPEVYLEESDVPARVAKIHETMEDYAHNVLTRAVDGFVYVERTERSGRVRQGLVGKIDLEAYSYAQGARPAIRPSERTVEERIPPRMAVRRGACLETPHVMMLADDPACTLIEPIGARKNELRKVYEGELMLGGGHIAGWAVEDPALLALISWSDANMAGICFGSSKKQSFTLAGPHIANVLSFEDPVAPLTVGTIDEFIEYFMARHKEARVDYVHDEPAVRALTKQGGVGFLLPPFEKSDLFKGIVMGGVLPRKTFSMGHAEEKRYYIECRKIIE